MKKFAFFSDILFTFFVSFLFTLCLFRYLGVKLTPAVALAALCGLLTAAAVGSILQIRRKNLHLKKSDETQKEKLLLHLALLSDEGKTDFARHFLSSEETPVNRFSRLRVCSPSEFYFLKFSLAPVNADEIARLSRFKTGKQKILLCSQIEENANSLCSRLGIQVKTGEWVYRQVKEKSLLPEHYLGDDSGVRKTKRKVKLWFAKSNAKRFLVGGALVLLLARLTPFYYYYLLLGCLLLLSAIFVRIFGYV